LKLVEGLRRSGAFGPDYIRRALVEARALAPLARLMLNEYSLESRRSAGTAYSVSLTSSSVTTIATRWHRPAKPLDLRQPHAGQFPQEGGDRRGLDSALARFEEHVWRAGGLSSREMILSALLSATASVWEGHRSIAEHRRGTTDGTHS
jgi:hypothetical protein